MAYKKIDMAFFDYNWNTKTGDDDPECINDHEHTELNRTEGFEMLHYINSLAKTWGWQTDNISSFRHLERIIRNEVPENIRAYADILNWIENNYNNI
jgi:hypothetical protein